ncbi:MAG: 16S rRNA processing protein RimM [Bdellovibrio sp.]|nr:16S rRNA processing protein RimM [Bdellovibrio sp.]
MNENQLTKIGKVFDAHGIRGDLVVTVFSKDISWLEAVETLNLVKDGKTIVVEVLKTRPHKKGFVCQLKGFDNRNLAEDAIGSEVWVDAEFFTSEEGESLYLTEILNFEVIDATAGSIGHIEAFSTNGMQDLLVIMNAQTKKSVEIPFVKEFVTELDEKNKKIFMSLPEGLLTINDPDDES